MKANIQCPNCKAVLEVTIHEPRPLSEPSDYKGACFAECAKLVSGTVFLGIPADPTLRS
jgi:hypothetical protein